MHTQLRGYHFATCQFDLPVVAEAASDNCPASLPAATSHCGSLQAAVAETVRPGAEAARPGTETVRPGAYPLLFL